MIRHWGSREVTQEDRRHFLEEIIAHDNLRRIFWFILVYFPVSLAFYVGNLFYIGSAELQPWVYFDFATGLVFVLLISYARRNAALVRWKHRLVLAFYAANLILMDGYYFGMIPRCGASPVYYILGMVMMAVVVHLPPRQSLSLLLINHAVFVGLLLASNLSSDDFMAAFFGGTNGLVLACLIAYFQFQRVWDNFQKGEVIAQRNHDLAEANDRLNLTNAKLNELMAVVAHDLRSPLCGLKGLFEVLKRDSAWTKQPYAEIMSECSSTCGSMVTMVSRLVDAHAAENWLRVVNPRRIDVLEITNRAMEKIRSSARSKRIVLLIESQAIELETDPDAVEQILDNLLSNAVKFSPPDSKVTVAMGSEGAGVWMEVRDEGLGIPENEREEIFTKFHRGGKSRPERDETGSGLGLFIVEQLTESLGGTIAYFPRKGNGSIFRLSLPLLAESVARGD